MKPSSCEEGEPGVRPSSTCSRTPGANLEAQPAFVEYLVSLTRVLLSMSDIVSGKSSMSSRGSWLNFYELFEQSSQRLAFVVGQRQRPESFTPGFQELVESVVGLGSFQ